MFTISFKKLKKEKEIGRSGFSIVYKGTYELAPVAVKQLFGIVYKSTHQFASVAIKQLHVDNLSPEAEEEFQREAAIMAQLRHPNVVHFYGYCTVPKCLVMEYMPQGSLFSVLHDKKKPLDWNIRIRIATNMVSGLAFLHSHNILHRNIKSLNVLLDGQGSAKLADFGLSQVKNETKSKMNATKTYPDSVGTVRWMAPELLEGKAVFTQKSDIYSLGVTLWELAAREIPYAKDTQAAISTLVQQGKREDVPRDCPEKLAYLIQHCWASDPNARPSASEIACFMTTDDKTLREVPKSPTVESTESQILSHRESFSSQPESSAFKTLQVMPSSSLSMPVGTPPKAIKEIPTKSALTFLYSSLSSIMPEPIIGLIHDYYVVPEEVIAFLKLVAEGEQDKAEAMLKSDPMLASVAGDVTDLSKRTFKNITALQYSLWALDWHMWTMLLKYIPQKEASEQIVQSEQGPWIPQHDVTANWENLIQALKQYVSEVRARKPEPIRLRDVFPHGKTWDQVGFAQLLLPAHVINEYCHPWRSFYPTPDFSKPEASGAWRSRTADDWVGDLVRRRREMLFIPGGLGFYRGNRPHRLVVEGCIHANLIEIDCTAVAALFKTRASQRAALVAQYLPKPETARRVAPG